MKTYMAHAQDVVRKWYVVDAEGVVLGRLVFTAPEKGNYGVVLKKDSGDRWTFPQGPDPLDLLDYIKVSEKEALITSTLRT